MRTQALAPSGWLRDGSRPITTDLRWVLATMYAGLALTVIATIVPYIERAHPTHWPTTSGRAIPPTARRASTRRPRSIWSYLSVVGVLGVVGWLWTVRSARRASGGSGPPRP